VLVSQAAYNNRGEAFETTDPSGTVMQTTWDDAGRKTKTIENYVNAGPVDSDTNVETQFTYNADGRLETLTAKNATTG
jgi:YD repeat-containing protein